MFYIISLYERRTSPFWQLEIPWIFVTNQTVANETSTHMYEDALVSERAVGHMFSAVNSEGEHQTPGQKWPSIQRSTNKRTDKLEAAIFEILCHTDGSASLQDTIFFFSISLVPSVKATMNGNLWRHSNTREMAVFRLRSSRWYVVSAADPWFVSRVEPGLFGLATSECLRSGCRLMASELIPSY